jgi:hypothetical protein
MNNLDEQKVKALLHSLVDGVYSLSERNYRNDMVVAGLHVQIDKADLLTTPAPCATVKAQIEEAAKVAYSSQVVYDSDVVLSVTRDPDDAPPVPIKLKRTPRTP